MNTRFSPVDVFPAGRATWERLNRARKVLHAAVWVVMALAVPWFLHALSSGNAWLVGVEAVALLSGMAAWLLLRADRVLLSAHCLAGGVTVFAITYATFIQPGGDDSRVVAHYLLLPVIVGVNFLFVGRHERWKWLYIGIAALFFWLVDTGLYAPAPRFETPPDVSHIAHHAVVLGALSGILVLSLIFVADIASAEKDLNTANERLELLIENMLPKAVADRLRSEGRTFADGFEECTILFADIAGFTRLSARLPPQEVVGLLNRVFSTFDELVEARGLEKIKTIGDAYMVAAGVPTSRPDHAQVMADLALAMRAAIEKEPDLDVRVGINSGEVVAGIIGRKRFIYDLWGDAVNVASRMESHGEVGTIQISEQTRMRLGNEFQVEALGSMPIKGKGMLECYRLIGRCDGARPPL